MKLEQVTGIKPDTRTFNGDDRLVLPKCYVGVESETEGKRYSRIQSIPFWNIVEDGSLRDGAEFVLSNPLVGEDLISALEVLEDKCRRGYKQSVRTSVHIHIDVRDLSAEQLLTFIGLYLIFEKAIYRYHNHKYNREDNIYCLPFYKTNRFLTSLGSLSYLKDTGFDEDELPGFLRQSLSQMNKYYGLNVASVFRFGSLEFRHMEGSTKKDAILQWINIIMSMKKYAMSFTGDHTQILQTISASGYKTLTNQVFSDELYDALFNYDNELEDIYSGMQIFQDILYHNVLERRGSVWNSYISKKNPEYKESKLYQKVSAKGKSKGRTSEVRSNNPPPIRTTSPATLDDLVLPPVTYQNIDSEDVQRMQRALDEAGVIVGGRTNVTDTGDE